MKLRFILGIILILIFAGGNPSLAGEDKIVYRQAIAAAKRGQYDFAYMHYRKLLRQFPGSRYAQNALFGQGEYFFITPDYSKARSVFETFIQKYPESKGKVFAQAYLYRIAQIQNNEDAVAKWEKEIATFKQVSLVFRTHKEYKYLSGMNKKHRMVIYIDRIEFFAGGELLAKVAYSD